jgi:hypothetical protein
MGKRKNWGQARRSIPQTGGSGTGRRKTKEIVEPTSENQEQLMQAALAQAAKLLFRANYIPSKIEANMTPYATGMHIILKRVANNHKLPCPHFVVRFKAWLTRGTPLKRPPGRKKPRNAPDLRLWARTVSVPFHNRRLPLQLPPGLARTAQYPRAQVWLEM